MKAITKKILLILLALTLTFAFAACDFTGGTAGGNNSGDETGDNGNGDTPPTCTAHTDENLDGKCDDCGAAVEIPEEKNECNQPGCDGEYVQSIQTPAKEFEDGTYLYTCDKCGDTYFETIPATSTI